MVMRTMVRMETVFVMKRRVGVWGLGGEVSTGGWGMR